MLFGKKSLGLVLAGLAAYAWYKYSQMDEDEKRDLVNNMKEKGKKIFGSIMPGKEATSANGQAYGQGAQYAG
jgi:hypothetical protein